MEECWRFKSCRQRDHSVTEVYFTGKVMTIKWHQLTAIRYNEIIQLNWCVTSVRMTLWQTLRWCHRASSLIYASSRGPEVMIKQSGREAHFSVAICKQNYFLKRLFHTNIYSKYFLSFWNIKTGKMKGDKWEEKDNFPWSFIWQLSSVCCKTLWSPWNVTLSHDFPRTGLDAQHLVLCLCNIAERRIPWWQLRASLGKTLSLSLLLSLSALPSSHFPTKSSESPPLLSQSARAATAKCQRWNTLNNRILFLAVLETKEAKFKLSGENTPHGS